MTGGIVRMLRELAGLFVDDASLAAALVVVVAVAAALSWTARAPSAIVGAALVFGCLAVLIENVLRSGSRKARSGSDR